MKKRIFAALAGIAFLLAPLTAFGAVDRAIVDSVGPQTLGQFYVGAHFMDGSTEVQNYNVAFNIGGVSTTQGLIDAAQSAITSYATSQGYTLTNGIVWNIISPTQVDAKIAAATSSLSSPVAMSFANPSRTLNSAFQVSASRAAFVNYSVDIAATLSLTTGQQGTVYLEYADDSGFTTNVKEVGRYVNGNTGTLTIGLALTQNTTAQVSGIIPAGKYVRLRTQNNTGTPTFTFRSSQEVLMPSN